MKQSFASCVVEEAAVAVRVNFRSFRIPMAVAHRSEKLNDRIPSCEIGTKFTFSIHERLLDAWLTCARALLVSPGRSHAVSSHRCYNELALLDRSDCELSKFLQVLCSWMMRALLLASVTAASRYVLGAAATLTQCSLCFAPSM